MFKKVTIGTWILSAVLMTGCVSSVPMESKENDLAAKTFIKPESDTAALYVYRNTFVGQGLKKNVYLDDVLIGETANKVYFYKVISPGKHKLSTESEFSDNAIFFDAIAGNNYFAEQYLKMGVFVGGANLRMLSEEAGIAAVKECGLAVCK